MLLTCLKRPHPLLEIYISVWATIFWSENSPLVLLCLELMLTAWYPAINQNKVTIHLKSSKGVENETFDFLLHYLTFYFCSIITKRIFSAFKKISVICSWTSLFWASISRIPCIHWSVFEYPFTVSFDVFSTLNI